jgi:HSP20 family protein
VTERNPLTELERVFDVATGRLGGELLGLQVDVVDEGEAFRLYADVPGVDPEDVDVRIGDGREVTVEVRADRESEVLDAEFVVRERSHRSTSRTVSVPAPIEESGAQATIDDGVLDVVLPKREGDGDGTEIPVE